MGLVGLTAYSLLITIVNGIDEFFYTLKFGRALVNWYGVAAFCA